MNQKAPKNHKDYFALKKYLMDKEEENYRNIYLLESSDGYYKIFGHSLILYRYLVCPRLKLIPTIKEDSDFQHKSKEGVISIKNLESLKNRLRALGIPEVLMVQPEIVCFSLNAALPIDKYQYYANLLDVKKEELHKVLKPKKMDPVIYLGSLDIVRSLKERFSSMQGAIRDMFMKNVMDHATRLAVSYIRMSRGEIGLENYKIIALDDLGFLMSWLLVAEECNIVNVEQAARITSKLVEVRKAVESLA